MQVSQLVITEGESKEPYPEPLPDHNCSDHIRRCVIVAVPRLGGGDIDRSFSLHRGRCSGDREEICVSGGEGDNSSRRTAAKLEGSVEDKGLRGGLWKGDGLTRLAHRDSPRHCGSRRKVCVTGLICRDDSSSRSPHGCRGAIY